ncbi:MAG: 2Fe-2S iron-sulfur cluster binding domain-containing protein [Afipia sp.]|nr:2Fe-2S iron-sulfur cluster binding domain-containing protein [Afipia sp.]
MPTIVYVEPDGQRKTIRVDPGANVMRTAVSQGISGIVAECGGAAMCATCHVYVESESADHLPPMGDIEDEMLESATAERLENSRLSCQINVTEEMGTVVVRIPERQS